MVIFCLCSCNSSKQKDDPFLDLYKHKPDLKMESVEEKKLENKISFSCKDMMLSDFARWFSDTTGMGVVYDYDVSELKITAEFKDATYKNIISTISKRLKLDLVTIGNTYFIGKIEKEDRGVLLRKVKGFDKDQLTSALDSIISDDGKTVVYTTGLVVVSDKEQVLNRINVFLNQLESFQQTCWVCQIYIVAVSKDEMLQGGVEFQPSGKLSYDIASAATGATGLDYEAKAEAIVNSDFSSNFSKLLYSPMYLLREGTYAEWFDGEVVPIPLKSVTEYGVVEITGYEYIDTGFTLKIGVSESLNGALIDLDLTNSRVSTYVEEAPQVKTTKLNQKINIESGKIYLMGELNNVKVMENQSKFFMFEDSEINDVIQVWGRFYRIQGASLKDYHKLTKED